MAEERIYNDELDGGVGCPDCGALVYSTERHDEWHAKNDLIPVTCWHGEESHEVWVKA